jgi:hypothetical protein
MRTVGLTLAAVAGFALAGMAQANVVVVLNSGEASVSIIDKDTRREVRRFEVGKEPHHLLRTPDGKTLIVANAASNELIFLDPVTGAEQRRIRDIPDPYQLGYSPDRRWFVTASLRLDRVDVYAVQDDPAKPSGWSSGFRRPRRRATWLSRPTASSPSSRCKTATRWRRSAWPTRALRGRSRWATCRPASR